MTKEIQIRRGTEAQVNAMTPALGEVVVDTTNDRLCIGDGSKAGGHKTPNYKDIQRQNFTYVSAGGTANAITLTLSPALDSYAAGVRATFKATANNSGSTTFNINGLGVVTGKKKKNGAIVDLEDGDILLNGVYDIVHDGTYFQFSGHEVGSPGGFVYIGTFTASSSASLNITSAISSDYDDYVFVLNNISPSSNGANLIMRTSTNNGSSFDSSASDYLYSVHLNNAASGESTSNSTSATSVLCASSVSTGTDKLGVSGEIRIFNVNSTSRRKFITGQTSYIGSGGGTHLVSARIAGLRDGTESDIDAVQFLMSTGNISVGTIKIYGLSRA